MKKDLMQMYLVTSEYEKKNQQESKVPFAIVKSPKQYSKITKYLPYVFLENLMPLKA